MSHYHPSRTLDDVIADALDSYAETRRQYYAKEMATSKWNWNELIREVEENPPEEILMPEELSTDIPGVVMVSVLERWSSEALRSAEEMVAPDQHIYAEIPRQDAQFLATPIGNEKLAIDLARKYYPATGGMINRCLDLATLAHQGQPSEAVGKYLRRLTHCYILELDAETVILSRAVLENAIHHLFESKDTPAPERMRARLDAAKMFGWISPPRANDAMTIWIRGNKAVHDDPDVTRDSLGTVRLLMGVLQEVFAT